MFYSSEKIKKILNCDFCYLGFVDVVKSLPECGRLICGRCHDNLRDLIGEQERFKCIACEKEHAMPHDGLADAKAIMDMLQLEPEKKALNPESKALKNLIEDVQERVEQLLSFDAKEEINSYCDELLLQFMETVESSVQRINKQGEELANKINEYRYRLLTATSEPQLEDSMMVDSEDSFEETQTSDGEESFQMPPEEMLQFVCDEIEKQADDWHDYFTKVDKAASNDQITWAISYVQSLEVDLKKIKTAFMDSAFKRKFMFFRFNQRFAQSSKHIGDLVIGNSINKNSYEIRSKPLCTITAVVRVSQALFLQDGNLATCGNEKTVRIWNPQTGDMLHKLDRPFQYINCLAQLENDWLAGGTGDASIILWVKKLIQKGSVATDTWEERAVLKGRPGLISSLKVLPNGHLASWAPNYTIRIWNPYLAGDNVVGTICNSRRCAGGLGVLPDGRLVTSSREERENSVLTIWDYRSLTLSSIKSITLENSLEDPKALLVLADDRVAIGFSTGTIRLVDLEDSSVVILKQSDGVTSLLQLPNGFLVTTQIADKRINIWDIESGQLVKSILTKHTSELTTLSISPDGSYLASGSIDKTVQVWTFEA